MKVKMPKTEAEYRQGKRRAAELIDATLEEEVAELELWSIVLEKWEQHRFPIEAPTPVEAIRFRLEQAALKPRDLVPHLGSRARVSEILSGQRPLSTDMMRALNRHLGIPADVLLGGGNAADGAVTEPSQAATSRLRAMRLMRPRETFAAYLARAFGPAPVAALQRKTRTERTKVRTDTAALQGWLAGVLLIADALPLPTCKRSALNNKAARRLAKLSAKADGIAQVPAFLAGLGVAFVKLEHLPGTYLDGAALLRRDGKPVIALTVRHDRVDNFWFTLLHEFAHICLHLSDERRLILDDLELHGPDEVETEADEFAQEALIPSSCWSAMPSDATMEDVASVARAAGVNEAIVAGRWQREHGDYRRFSKNLGRGEVRCALERALR